MDTMRGNFSERDSGDELNSYDAGDYDSVRELPPAAIGQDERRMQVRAYNYWAGLLDERNFPSVEDIEPENLPDFGPYSVLLDFSTGIENPAIQFLGDKLALECGANGPIKHLSDVPTRSLLSRITDHYLQIIANQAPIGFEAEFVNQRGSTILYRGILLPFSSDDDTIDFIYGVINWKELADQQTADQLLHEIDQALEAAPLALVPSARDDSPLADWADVPVGEAAGQDWPEADPVDLDDELDLTSDMELAEPAPVPAVEADWDLEQPQAIDLTPAMEAPPELSLAGLDEAPDAMELADWLASARELAQAAQGSEDRSRQALYAAIGRAYDFALAAEADPEGYAELIADSGLSVQERAPMTPVVKLVFGASYDKTRLAEYAAVLGHASRQGIAQGALASWLGSVPGGLKAVVSEERRLRRGEDAKPLQVREDPRPGILRKLRKIEYRSFRRSSGRRQRVRPADRPPHALWPGGSGRRSWRRCAPV